MKTAITALLFIASTSLVFAGALDKPGNYTSPLSQPAKKTVAKATPFPKPMFAIREGDERHINGAILSRTTDGVFVQAKAPKEVVYVTPFRDGLSREMNLACVALGKPAQFEGRDVRAYAPKK